MNVMTATSHARDIELRRLRAGELGDPAGGERARLEAHLASCAACRAKLGALEDEQQAFAQEISFERFAGGVERAARVPKRVHRRPTAWLTTAAVGLAAAAALVLVLRPARGPSSEGGGNNLKGAAVEASLRIGGGDGRAQRMIETGGAARLSPGDSLRLGYRTDRPRHLVALAVDDHGVVSALYPEQGPSLAVPSSAAVTYLPDAITLDGKGRERVFVLLGEQAFTVEQAAEAVRAARQRAGGDLGAMGQPALGGAFQGFSWLLEKP